MIYRKKDFGCIKKAGVNTKHRLYKGTTYKFFGMAAVVPEAKDDHSLAVEELKSAFNK